MKITKIYTVSIIMFLFFFIFSGINLKAQNGKDTLTMDDLFDMDLEQLMNLEVISSSKSEQKVSVAPNVISLINSTQIHAYGWSSLNDILYKHPGFFPSQDYDRRTVGFRGNFEGWNNNHLMMLIDGVPFNDNLYGTAYTWEITPLIFTKSVEIIRGPGAALYGTNATNGVVTMNTMSFKDFGNNKVFLNASYGEQNTHNYDVISGFNTKLFSNVTSISIFKTDSVDYNSYDGSGELDQNGILKKFDVKDNRQSAYFFTKFEGENKLKGLDFQFHHQQWEYETGHGWLWNIPDNKETMKESRDIFMLKYSGKISDKLSHEYVVRYQLHNIDWDLFYYRKSSEYTWGANEYLKTHGQDLFTRIQYQYLFSKKANILTALETSSFYYNGDTKHYSNFDLTTFESFSNNEHRDLGSWFQPIEKKPINTISGFMQFASGEWLGKYLVLTAGMRYDIEFFKYIDLTDVEAVTLNKNFHEFSPRLALIILPTNKFTIKLMYGKGFRAPTPTEMFGSNTWTLASNLKELEPERLQTYEIALDYQLTKKLVARLNTFYNKTEGQIAYSLGNNNLSTNIYTLENIGLESEIQLTSNTFFGFVNASYVKRVNEDIYKKEQVWVSENPDSITWAPSIIANIGLGYHFNKINASVLSHYQGEVLRRKLDLYSQAELTAMGLTEQPRENSVKAWISFDAKISYKFKYVEVGLSAVNILNTPNYLVKNLKYPFDYKMNERRIMFTTLISF